MSFWETVSYLLYLASWNYSIATSPCDRCQHKVMIDIICVTYRHNVRDIPGFQAWTPPWVIPERNFCFLNTFWQVLGFPRTLAVDVGRLRQQPAGGLASRASPPFLITHVLITHLPLTLNPTPASSPNYKTVDRSWVPENIIIKSISWNFLNVNHLIRPAD